MNKMLGNKKVIALYVLPALTVFTLFVFYPIIETLYFSFCKWDGITKPIFTGIKNYRKLFSDSLFYQSTLNGLVFAAVLVVFQMGLAALLTFALLRPGIKPGARKFFRSAYFIPVVLSVTVACQLWSSIYDPTNGLINKLFSLLHINYQQAWLSDTREPIAIIAVAFVNVWQCMGYQFAIIYASAKSLPPELCEAARIDGATEHQLNSLIRMPLMADTFRMGLIIAITGGLNAYAHINLMTAGGPGTSTYSLTYMTFREAFTIGKFGYGCTAAVALIVQCVVATLAINKLMNNKIVHY